MDLVDPFSHWYEYGIVVKPVYGRVYPGLGYIPRDETKLCTWCGKRGCFVWRYGVPALNCPVKVENRGLYCNETCSEKAMAHYNDWLTFDEIKKRVGHDLCGPVCLVK